MNKLADLEPGGDISAKLPLIMRRIEDGGSLRRRDALR
jgi:hypothetical protein